MRGARRHAQTAASCIADINVKKTADQMLDNPFLTVCWVLLQQRCEIMAIKYKLSLSCVYDLTSAGTTNDADLLLQNCKQIPPNSRCQLQSFFG